MRILSSILVLCSLLFMISCNPSKKELAQSTEIAETDSSLVAKIKLVNMDEAFTKATQLSCLDARQDTLYSVSEECGKLLRFGIKNDSLRSLGSTDLKAAFSTDKLDLEAVALYKNYAFITDEGYKSGFFKSYNKIRAIDLYEQKEVMVEMPKELEKLEGESKGFEGMEAYESKGLLYVMREKEGDGKPSILYTLKITTAEDKLKLSLLSTLKIKHSSSSKRCPALALSPDHKFLYILRVKYGSYFIDRLELDAEGMLPQGEINAQEVSLINMSKSAQELDAQNYSTNIEGLVALDSSLLIISDNGGKNCDEAAENKTLLGRIVLD